MIALIPTFQPALKPAPSIRRSFPKSKILAGEGYARNVALLLIFLLTSGLAAMGQGASQPGSKASRQNAGKQPSAPAQPRPTAASVAARAASQAALDPNDDAAANYRLPDGLTYFYDVDWRLVKAGTATLGIGAAGAEQRILGTADANGVVGALYRVHDHFESFFDSNSFCSRSISKQVEEGFRKVNTDIRFDYARGKNVLDEKNLRTGASKHVESAIPPCVSGILPAVYFVASRSLLPNATYSFPINDGEHTVRVKVHVEAREMIKTPAGNFKTVRVQPEAESGPLREKGKLWIWYSDDAARIPVQIRARLSWGTLTMHLQHVEKH